MKNNYIIYCILAFTLFLVSCSNFQKITNDSFVREYKAKLGEKVNVKWNFENAVSVKIKNYPNSFQKNDSINIIAKEDTLIFMAENTSHKYFDTSFIKIIKDGFTGKESIVAKGAETYFPSSLLESQYLSGISDVIDENQEQVRIKLIRQNYLDIKSKNLKFVVLDQNGNFIPNFFKSKSNQNLLIKNNFEFGVIAQTIQNYKIKENSYSEDKSIYSKLLIENSISMLNLSTSFDEISDFVNRTIAEDKFSLYTFNQNQKKIIENLSYNDASEILVSLDKVEISGLNSLYRSLLHSISEIKKDNSLQNPYIVAFVNSNDNCTFDIEMEDVIKEAQLAKIPIYFISKDEFVETYFFKHIAELTGGNFYSLNDNVESLDEILYEIYLGNYYNYEIEIDTKEISKNQNDYLFSEILLSEKNLKVEPNNFTLSGKDNNVSIPFKLISIFEKNKSDLSKEFGTLNENLAKLLLDNPDFKIELIGHSFAEASTIALSRAQNVKKKLIELGANSNQILVRSESANKPMYFMPQESWQESMNRRVEVRWLDPDLFPFEIVTEKIWTESEAENKVTSWETRGYRAYYERNISEDLPIYLVKLWGYKTIEDAMEISQELKNKYKIRAEVK